MGCIVLEGMEFFASVGYYQEEKQIQTKFTIDVLIWTDLMAPAREDDLDLTINYETIHQFCARVMTNSYDLIETIGYEIVQEIKQQWPHIERVKVRVSKWHPPLSGHVSRAYIEIEQ